MSFISPKKAKVIFGILILSILTTFIIQWSDNDFPQNSEVTQTPTNFKDWETLIQSKFTRLDQFNRQGYENMRNEIIAQAAYSNFNKSNPSQNTFIKTQLLQELEVAYCIQLTKVAKHYFNLSQFDGYVQQIGPELQKLMPLPSIKNQQFLGKEAAAIQSILQTHASFLAFCQSLNGKEFSIEEDNFNIQKSKRYLSVVLRNNYLKKDQVLKQKLQKVPQLLFDLQISNLQSAINNPMNFSGQDDCNRNFVIPMYQQIKLLKDNISNYQVDAYDFALIERQLQNQIDTVYKKYFQ
jgi:hypothetical protein